MIALYLILIGLILIVSGARGKGDEIGEIIKSDFTGNPSFMVWIVAVIIIGLFASFKQTRQLGNNFYVLLIVVLFLSNGGFWAEFNKQALR